MKEIRQRLINEGGVIQVMNYNGFLSLENNEWVIKRIDFKKKELVIENVYNDFEVALIKLLKR